MILTAHQCNFFPYSGVLDKARAADVFVGLGHVQFTRNNYHNRFSLGDKWYTMSVSQKLEPLIEKRYRVDDWHRIKRQLPAYAKLLADFDDCIGESLVETNTKILERLFVRLGIKTNIVSDYPTDLTSTERLVDICKRYGAIEYLSGPSGKKYIDESKFNEARIKLSYFRPTSNRAAIELLA